MQSNDRLIDPLKEASLRALGRITESLTALMIDTGVTVQEYSKLVRERAVQTAATRLLQEEGRASKTRLSIITGLSRAEVARILAQTVHERASVREPLGRLEVTSAEQEAALPGTDVERPDAVGAHRSVASPRRARDRRATIQPG